MKQMLSGKNWTVTPFHPDEASACSVYPAQAAEGTLSSAETYPARVPGDVQSDLLDAGVLRDIGVAWNAREAEWTYQREWMYVTSFTAERDAKRIRLCFGGVDYACDVYLNGEWLGRHENLFLPFSFDITGKVTAGERCTLGVLVKAAPQQTAQHGAASEVTCLKPRFAYGWDWCTRLVPLGIWQDVWVSYEDGSRIDDLYCHADTDWRSRTAEVTAEVTLANAGDETVCVTLTDPEGNVLAEKKVRFSVGQTCAKAGFRVENALLWQVNGYGGQPLYTVTAEKEDGEREVRRIGLRRIEWIRTKGAGEDALCYQPVVNGRPVFLKGYNFVPVRQLYGRVHEDVYRRRIALAKDAHITILRVWGGGLLERECFYDLCDRAGILVMQELFQSSGSRNNHPSRDEAYIRMMTETAASAVMQRRGHACLAIWCGGNELCVRGHYMTTAGETLVEGAEGHEGYEYSVKGSHWVPLDPEYPTLRAMRATVKALDPETHWLHTSGSGPFVQNMDIRYAGGGLHDVHGPWRALPPETFYDLYNRADMMIHFEFGCPGPASVPMLEKIVPGRLLWPLDENNPMTVYHGRMWSGTLTACKAWFGELHGHREFSLAGRFLQWEQLRYSLEAHRSLGRRCAGAVVWHMAEPWPNVSDTCSVDADDRPKPAWYGVKTGFKPLHIAARCDNASYPAGCVFTAGCSVLNSLPADFSGTAELFIRMPGGSVRETKSARVFCPADDAVQYAMKAEFTAPEGYWFLCTRLRGEDGTVLDEGYTVRSSREIPWEPLLRIPAQDMTVRAEGDALLLTNCGTLAVCGVTVEQEKGSFIFSDGCMLILPGETKKVLVTAESGGEAPGTVTVSGFGVPRREIPAETLHLLHPRIR